MHPSAKLYSPCGHIPDNSNMCKGWCICPKGRICWSYWYMAWCRGAVPGCRAHHCILAAQTYLQSSYHWIISAFEEEVYRHTAGKQDRTYMLSMRSQRENHRVNCLSLMCILFRSAVPILWDVDPLGPMGFSPVLYKFTQFHNMSWSFSQCLIYCYYFCDK